jgi:hypothetical protein
MRVMELNAHPKIKHTIVKAALEKNPVVLNVLLVLALRARCILQVKRQRPFRRRDEIQL